MTSPGWFLTGTVLVCAGTSTALTAIAGSMWSGIGLLSFWLLCQAAVTCYESAKSARNQTWLLTAAFNAAERVNGPAVFYDAVRGRPVVRIDPHRANGDATSATATVPGDQYPDSSAASDGGPDVESE